MERWGLIEDGRYAVSDHGRVKRAEGSRYAKAGRVLKPSTGRLGYPRVVLCNDGEEKTLFIHHAVALLFIGERPEGYVVDHIDGSRDNNHHSNLRYITHSENIRRGYDGKRGENHHASKLTDSQAEDIKSRRENGERGCDLAIEYGVSQQTICDISKGRSRKEV